MFKPMTRYRHIYANATLDIYIIDIEKSGKYRICYVDKISSRLLKELSGLPIVEVVELYNIGQWEEVE